MKQCLLATLLLLGFVCEARPVHRPFRHIPRKIELIRAPSWKQITAGGVALGTVVGAYKVADGVQDGLQEAAEKRPEQFISLLSGLTLPFRFTLWCICLAGLVWTARKFYEKYNTRNRKGETKR